MQTKPFAAEVSRLLDIVVHSLYSDRAIFLRELVANAADACEKLRYEALTRADLLPSGWEPKIRLIADKKARTLTVTDNGIGMSDSELADNLGTIARSGTAAFLERVSKGDAPNPSMIGQFGVGFYSAFMVADRVDVLSRKAGESASWLWTSDGKTGFTIEAAETTEATGTRIVLHLKADADEFLEESRLKEIIRVYADHIDTPIFFGDDATAPRLNQGVALWTRPKSEITSQQYTDFYRYVAAAWDEPALSLQWQAEGAIDYKGLLFVPSSRPLDLFDPKREHAIKLYVRRVFITSHAPGLVPPWLRFMRGVIDSEDLPLNVSREMLQNNPVLAKMRQGITRKVLAEIEKWGGTDKAAYELFWANFGAVLKEGLYEDRDHHDGLLKLLRARSTAVPGLVSLDEYIARMQPDQKNIYFITGEDVAALAKSPHIEGLKARGIEVLLLTDSVDSFWPGIVGAYKDKPLMSATRGAADLKPAEKDSAETEKAKGAQAATDHLIAFLKTTLGEFVKDVRPSLRLTDSPVCLVADEGDPDLRLERLLRQHGQMQTFKRILEINPGHPLIKALADRVGTGTAGSGSEGAGDAVLVDAAWLLLDQARLMDGDSVIDTVSFARRLSAAMSQGLTGISGTATAVPRSESGEAGGIAA